MNFTNTQPNDKLKGINKNEKKNERNNDTKKETTFKLNTRWQGCIRKCVCSIQVVYKCISIIYVTCMLN